MKLFDRMCQSVNVTGVKWMISTLRIHGAGMPFNVTLNENTSSLAIRGKYNIFLFVPQLHIQGSELQ